MGQPLPQFPHDVHLRTRIAVVVVDLGEQIQQFLDVLALDAQISRAAGEFVRLHPQRDRWILLGREGDDRRVRGGSGVAGVLDEALQLAEG